MRITHGNMNHSTHTSPSPPTSRRNLHSPTQPHPRPNSSTPPISSGSQSSRRSSAPRDPPVGAIPVRMPPILPPPIGAIPLATQHHHPPLPPPPPSSCMPLLASQLGHPVSLNGMSPTSSSVGQLLRTNASSSSSSSVSGGSSSAPPLMTPSAASLSPIHLMAPLAAAMTTADGKIIARNVNGTFAVTTQPNNESELQLYRVLQRANLLSYYDVFIQQGGDDVHQLIEAGEEEFLEIMALVGMASKPLHVRRLQKALHEWAQNPAPFQTPLVPLSSYSAPSAAAAVIHRTNTSSTTSSNSNSGTSTSTTSGNTAAAAAAAAAAAVAAAASAGHLSSNQPTHYPPSTATRTTHSVSSGTAGSLPISSTRPSPPPPPASNHSSTTTTTINNNNITSNVSSHHNAEVSRRLSESPRHSPSPAGGTKDASTNSGDSTGAVSPAYSQSGSDYPLQSTSPSLTPVLVESQIQKIHETACNLVKSLPPFVEPKQSANKKKLNKDLEMILSMTSDDPRRMEKIRSYSAIYGRFDCKRKPEKPLTAHEVSVNEAAAQLCSMVPALLTRRDELFPLARQVVRDSGYQFSKGHSRSQFIGGFPSKLLQGGAGSGGEGDSNSRDSVGTNGSSSGRKRKRTSASTGDGAGGGGGGGAGGEMHQHQTRKRERFDQINEELGRLSDRLDGLQSALKHARDTGSENNNAVVAQLVQQIEAVIAKQMALNHEQQDIAKYLRPSRLRSGQRISVGSDVDRVDTDDDSQMSYSNASSPLGPQNVVSQSGDQIIAVQNPALSMSAALAKSQQQPQSLKEMLSTTLSSTTTSGSSTKTSITTISPPVTTFKQEPSSPSTSSTTASASADKD